jgi:hypothetical protein
MVTDPLSGAVPNELRDFTDRSVEQARKAFDGFIGVVSAAIERQPASDESATPAYLSRLAIGFAERNVQGAFTLAHDMVHAADLAEVLRLQREFLETQMRALKSQMRSLGKAGKAPPTSDAEKPPGRPEMEPTASRS